MTQKYRLLALDLDGTLTNSKRYQWALTKPVIFCVVGEV